MVTVGLYPLDSTTGGEEVGDVGSEEGGYGYCVPPPITDIGEVTSAGGDCRS